MMLVYIKILIIKLLLFKEIILSFKKKMKLTVNSTAQKKTVNSEKMG